MITQYLDVAKCIAQLEDKLVKMEGIIARKFGERYNINVGELYKGEGSSMFSKLERDYAEIILQLLNRDITPLTNSDLKRLEERRETIFGKILPPYNREAEVINLN